MFFFAKALNKIHDKLYNLFNYRLLKTLNKNFLQTGIKLKIILMFLNKTKKQNKFHHVVYIEF